jgi:lysophospholipase L1-like esterase
MKRLAYLLLLFPLFLIAHQAHAQTACTSQNSCFGFGPPTGACQGGIIYADISATPVQLYACKNTWTQAGGSGGGGGGGTWGSITGTLSAQTDLAASIAAAQAAAIAASASPASVAAVAAAAANASNLTSGVVPANQSQVASVNGKTGAVKLSPFDVGAIVGPGAGSSQWYTATEQGGTTIDTVQGFLAYMLPTASNSIQIVFGNSSQTFETCGPSMTVRAAIEAPIDTTPLPLFFNNGQRDVSISPCGIAVSDPIQVDTTLAQQLVYIRFKATRAAGDSTSFPAGWIFNAIKGSSVLAPYTTTKTSGSFDGVEELRTRTVADGVCTAASTAFTSATAAFVAQDAGQTITLPGCGASGAAYTTTIATYTNATTVTLTLAATTAATAVAAAIVPTDKTLTGTIFTQPSTAILTTSYAPLALLAKPAGVVKSVGLVGDSITAGTGDANIQGGWGVRSLDIANSTPDGTGIATRMHANIPYLQSSMPGDTAANYGVSRSHRTRYSQLGRVKFVLGMLGTNDIGTGGVTPTTLETSLITVCTQLRNRGPLPYYGTIVPRSTSTDLWLTLAGQTTIAGNASRVTVNNWIRDGMPISSTTLLPVVAGSSPTTSNRTNFWGTTGTLISAASGPAVHPCAGAFELADTVESARDSGLWAANPNTRLVFDGVTNGTTTVTSATAAFVPSDVGRWINIFGAGTAGALFQTTILTYVSPTQVITFGAAPPTNVTGAELYIDTILNTPGMSVDGIHPTTFGHHQMALSAAAMEAAAWTF